MGQLGRNTCEVIQTVVIGGMDFVNHGDKAPQRCNSQ